MGKKEIKEEKQNRVKGGKRRETTFPTICTLNTHNSSFHISSPAFIEGVREKLSPLVL